MLLKEKKKLINKISKKLAKHQPNAHVCMNAL